MYESFFGLKDNPFSIAPDPRFLYMSGRHKEALAHLLYGLEREGGFVLLTGEVGTGKTTICRKFLQNVPANTEIAFVLYPKLTARELLATICDEVGISCPDQSTTKYLVDLIHKHLLEVHAQGKHTALIIDEAQNLPADVLEQLRLLTNLETDKKKLLQIILLGQPELNEILNQRELRQLSQRVTARYHLGPLSLADVSTYMALRLSVAGCNRPLFDKAGVRIIHKASRGIPRLINLICDRALLGAYSRNEPSVNTEMIKQAVKEVFSPSLPGQSKFWPRRFLSRFIFAVAAFVFSVTIAYMLGPLTLFKTPSSSLEQADSVVTNEKPAEMVNGEVSTDSLTRAMADPVPKVTDGEPKLLTGDADTEFIPAGLTATVTNSEFKPFNQYQPSADNTGLAYRSVLGLWNTPVKSFYKSEARNCQRAAQFGLECLHRKGNWRSLLQLNRPAVLTLANKAGTIFKVSLTDMTEDRVATLELDGESYKMPLATLDRYWHGKYSLIWKVPPYKSGIIAPGAIQNRGEWLQKQFDLRDSLLDENRAEANSGKLSERVKAFQQDVGILPDGIPGTMTIIMLNSWTQPDVPLLLAKDKS